MQNLLLSAKKIHCVGVKGAGLSALAGILGEQGKIITGSDASGPPHDEKNITDDLDLVIYSTAVNEENVERIAATSRHIPQLSYPEALGQLTKQHETIAICGTHGKTTTASMTAILLQDEIDPTVLIGAPVQELGNRNYRTGEGNHLIIEACEYQRHFLNYQPSIITITNVELDHLDYFENENDYRDAFSEFLLKLPEGGRIVANADDPNVRMLCDDVLKERSDVVITFFDKNHPCFTAFDLIIPGEHNRYNAVAALLTAQTVAAIEDRKAIQKLNTFRGAGRRFEQFLSSTGTIIIDDYAHHPTAIRATLKAARAKFGPDKKILCVFQPHQYSRTIKLFKEFSGSFELADEVIIPNIFQARDTIEDMQSISPETLVEAISRHHKRAYYGHGLDKTFDDIQNRISDFDVIICMGAGDITTLAHRFKSFSR